jgi:hypothetical protein
VAAQRWQYSPDMTLATALDRRAQRGQPDKTAWAVQPRQNREDEMPGHDSKDRTVGTRVMEQEKLGQGRWDRTAREDSWDSIARIGNGGQLWKDSQDMTSGAGPITQDSRDRSI